MKLPDELLKRGSWMPFPKFTGPLIVSIFSTLTVVSYASIKRR